MTALAARRADAAVVVGGVVALATVVVGVHLRRDGVAIGTPTPPFLGPWSPELSPWVALAAVVLAAAVRVGPRLVARPLGPARFAASATLLALAARIAVALVRDGGVGLYGVFDPARSFEAKNEYLPALRALTYGTGFFLDRFAQLVPALPPHAAGHPPGLLLTLHWLGIDSAGGMAALCIGVGVLAVPLTYLLARELLDEGAARVATLLLVLSPAAIDFGATSADALYATLGVVAALLLVRWPLAGAAALALASFFSWSLLAVGAWCAIVVWRRDGLRRGVVMSLACAVALVVFYGLLAAATGYDPIGTLRATGQVYRLGIASMRPYDYWVFGSPVAWAVATGIPIAALWLRAAARGSVAALALVAVIAVSTLGGFTKAETERIWLFFGPLACIAAAELLPRKRLPLVLTLLAVQVLAAEILFDSVW